MTTTIPLLQFLDGLSEEDRNYYLGRLLSPNRQGASPGILSRKVVKIHNIGPPEEILQSISDATGIPPDQLPPIDFEAEKRKLKENWEAVLRLTDPYMAVLKADTKSTEDKKEELTDLGRFIIASGLDFKILIPEKPLTYPDFTVALGATVHGIEHTRLIDPDKIKAIKAVKQFLENAHKILLGRNAAHIGTVNIAIDFDQEVIGQHNFKNIRFTKTERLQVTTIIADYIENVITGQPTEKPAFISSVAVTPNRDSRLDIELAENYLAKEGFASLLTKRIEAKEAKYIYYRTAATMQGCLLLIVVDGFSSFSGFDLDTEIFPWPQPSNFEMIIIFETFSGKYFVIYDKAQAAN